MLVPVIGLVQVGMQAIADRYTYLPSIGLFILLAWSLADIGSISIRWRNGMILGVIALLLACLVITRIQLKYWKDEIALFSRSVEINSENNLQGYYLLGHALWQAGNLGEAAECYRALLRMAPANIDARRELIAVLIAQKRFAAAKAELLVLLQFNPDAAEVMNDLAWISATCPDATVRDGEFAVRLAERACMLTEYKQALLIGTLAAAYAESGQFPAAVKAAQQARAMALAQGQNKVAASNEKLLEIYESGRAYHENERDSGDGF
jgi:tetratricopeptide (TPR) repeat protein